MAYRGVILSIFSFFFEMGERFNGVYDADFEHIFTSDDIIAFFEYLYDSRYNMIYEKDIIDFFDYTGYADAVSDLLVILKILKKIDDNVYFLDFETKIVADYYQYREDLNEYIEEMAVKNSLNIINS